jgi:hypothetical protein
MTFDELNNLKAVARKYGGLNLGEVDQLIDTAERHLASAGQLRQMREALEAMKTTFSAQGRDPGHWPPLNFDERQALDIAEQHGYGRLMQLLSAAWYADQRGGAFAVGTCVSLAAKAMRTLEDALTLTTSQAEATAKANAEAAAQVPGLTEQARQMREALERLSQPSACGCKPCRGSCFSEQSLRIELEERMQIAMDALALTPSQAEQQARENAEAAALLEWWFDESNEDARESIRCKRMASAAPWTAEQWIDALRKAAKEATNV